MYIYICGCVSIYMDQGSRSDYIPLTTRKYSVQVNMSDSRVQMSFSSARRDFRLRGSLLTVWGFRFSGYP